MRQVIVRPVKAPKLLTSNDLPEGPREMRDEVHHQHQMAVLRVKRSVEATVRTQMSSPTDPITLAFGLMTGECTHYGLVLKA